MSDILSFYCPTRIYMGKGAHRKVEHLIEEWKIHRLFLVVDHAILKTEFYSLVEDILKKKEVSFEIYTDIEPDPGTGTMPSRGFAGTSESRKG